MESLLIDGRDAGLRVLEKGEKMTRSNALLTGFATLLLLLLVAVLVYWGLDLIGTEETARYMRARSIEI